MFTPTLSLPRQRGRGYIWGRGHFWRKPGENDKVSHLCSGLGGTVGSNRNDRFLSRNESGASEHLSPVAHRRIEIQFGAQLFHASKIRKRPAL